MLEAFSKALELDVGRVAGPLCAVVSVNPHLTAPGQDVGDQLTIEVSVTSEDRKANARATRKHRSSSCFMLKQVHLDCGTHGSFVSSAEVSGLFKHFCIADLPS